MTEVEVVNILYKHFEFFLSKEDIRTLFPLENNLTYTEYLNNIAFMYEKKNEDKVFQYNIRFVPIYIEIKEKLKAIKKILQTEIKSESEQKQNEKNIKELHEQLKKLIKDSKTHTDLYFYQEEYIYAHHKMNEFRNNSDAFDFENDLLYGGGITLTLEQFKQKIRDKIMRL
jgi:hypothetical protein